MCSNCSVDVKIAHVCQVCDNRSVFGEAVYDVGFVCQNCLDRAENKTGYCSMSCQLFGTCDGSC